MTWTHTVVETDWSDTGPAELTPRIACALGYSHLVVYGDREHYANLIWDSRPLSHVLLHGYLIDRT